MKLWIISHDWTTLQLSCLTPNWYQHIILINATLLVIANNHSSLVFITFTSYTKLTTFIPIFEATQSPSPFLQSYSFFLIPCPEALFCSPFWTCITEGIYSGILLLICLWHHYPNLNHEVAMNVTQKEPIPIISITQGEIKKLSAIFAQSLSQLSLNCLCCLQHLHAKTWYSYGTQSRF